MKTVKEIVRLFIMLNGYDGLYNSAYLCGCKLPDLMPCEEYMDDCKAGYLMECDCGEGCDWHVGPNRNIKINGERISSEKDIVKMNKKEAIGIVIEELETAIKNFGSFNSPHEGYAVILEELDELWEKIKYNESPELLKEEAKQVAAMSIRFLIDCCI